MIQEKMKEIEEELARKEGNVSNTNQLERCIYSVRDVMLPPEYVIFHLFSVYRFLLDAVIYFVVIW